jgi:phosphoribosylpyrophosphate synthetase
VLLEHFKQVGCDLVVVSPDAGGVDERAPNASANLAIIDKRRERPNQAN